MSDSEEVLETWQRLVGHQLTRQRRDEFLTRPETHALAAMNGAVRDEAGLLALTKNSKGHLLLGEWLRLADPLHQEWMRERREFEEEKGARRRARETHGGAPRCRRCWQPLDENDNCKCGEPDWFAERKPEVIRESEWFW
jgi:hypothetical protein